MVKKISIRLLIVLLALILFYCVFWFLKTNTLKSNIVNLAKKSSYHISLQDVEVTGFPLENKVTLKNLSFSIPGSLVNGEFQVSSMEFASKLFGHDFRMSNIGEANFKHGNGAIYKIAFNQNPSVQVVFLDEENTKISYSDSGLKFMSTISGQDQFQTESTSFSLTLREDSDHNVSANIIMSMKGVNSVNFLEIYKNSLEPKIIESFENGELKISKTAFDKVLEEADKIEVSNKDILENVQLEESAKDNIDVAEVESIEENIENDNFLNEVSSNDLTENVAENISQDNPNIVADQSEELVVSEAEDLQLISEEVQESANEGSESDQNKMQEDIKDLAINNEKLEKIEQMVEQEVANFDNLGLEVGGDILENDQQQEDQLAENPELQYIVVDEISSLSDDEFQEVVDYNAMHHRYTVNDEIDEEIFDKLNQVASDISINLVYKLTPLNNPGQIEIKSDPTKIAPLRVSYLKALDFNQLDIKNDLLELSIKGNLQTNADDPKFSGSLDVEINNVNIMKDYIYGATRKLAKMSSVNIEGSSIDANSQFEKDMYQIFLEKAHKNYLTVLNEMANASARNKMIAEIKQIREGGGDQTVNEESQESENIDDLTWLQKTDPEKYKELYNQFYSDDQLNLKVHREKNLEYMINDRTIRDIVNQL